MPSDWQLSKSKIEVLGREMAYVERGDGAPIVFLHGNPTSSFLWRSVMSELEGRGRLIAPDLIGMGDSEKLDAGEEDRYTFACHRRYLDALLDALDLGDGVTLVVHDWGSALGFDWGRRNPGRVRGVAYMEAIVRSIASWDEWPEAARGIFQAMRSPAGEELILDRNMFVERILPASIQRQLSEEEMEEYRRPFASPGEDRLPTLVWPREIPIEGEPTAVAEVVDAYSIWLAGAAEVPKLFVDADPGTILIGSQREFCRGWPNQTRVTVPGLHFIQEDSGAEIGAAIAAWLDRI